MGESLAPDVNHGHLVRLGEEVDVEHTTDDHTAEEQAHVEPQKICVFVTCEDEGLHLGERDIGEVHVEEEAEAELAHEEERGEGAPDVEVQEGGGECVEEQLWPDDLESDEQGHRCADRQVGARHQRFRKIPRLELRHCVLHQYKLKLSSNTHKLHTHSTITHPFGLILGEALTP